MGVSWKGIGSVVVSWAIAAVVMAQDPAGGQVEESPGGFSAGADEVPAAQMAEDFLAARGWAAGHVSVRNALFAIGIGSIDAPAGSDSFGLARRQAAQSALLNAKKDLATYLAAEVETAVMSFYAEGGGSPSADDVVEADSSPVPPSILSKATKLVEVELDGLLRDRGVDPNDLDGRAARSKAAEEVIASSEFLSAVQLFARQEIGALQVLRSFESLKVGQEQVACVVVYSPKSRSLQEALLGLGSVSDRQAGIPIAQWARELGGEVLLFTHGVQLRTDENGEVNLVIFGQSDPRTESSRSQAAARDKAKLNATAAARQFLGEMVYVAQSSSESSSLEEYADKTRSFDDTSEVLEEISARADRLRMPGISWVYSWQFTHPRATKPTFGVVGKLSLGSAMDANGLRELFEASAGSRGGEGIAGRSPADPPVGDGSAGSSNGGGRGGSGVGAEGEDPWFFGDGR